MQLPRLLFNINKASHLWRLLAREFNAKKSYSKLIRPLSTTRTVDSLNKANSYHSLTNSNRFGLCQLLNFRLIFYSKGISYFLKIPRFKFFRKF